MEIHLKGLYKTYENLNVIKDISLDVPSNKIFGIIGLSGAGKSTLVRMMSLLEAPDKGMVFYDNERVDNLSKPELIQRRRRTGMIFQNFNLFSSRTAGQNVAYPMEICGYSKEEIRQRVKELLLLVGLEDRINAPISTLSGGQKQRVAIARALACKPDVLFCDEATSALDPQTTRAILTLIKDIQKKMNLTVVMITHQMEVVRDSCDSVAVLNDGTVVEQGPVKEIFRNPKEKVTKDFLSHLSVSEKTAKWSEETGHFILRFPTEVSDNPVISLLSRKYNVDFNIFGGGVQEVDNEKFGTLMCDIKGKDADVDAAIKELKTMCVVEEVK